MHHSQFLAHLAEVYRPTTYVELGLYKGETVLKVLPFVKQVYGVDMIERPQLQKLATLSNVSISYTTTDEFFKTFTTPIDMAFIDADHNAVSVTRDLTNVLNLLNPGGIVCLHDTDPESNFLIDPKRCGDSYKLVDVLEKTCDLNILTLPIQEAGLSILQKKGSTRTQRRMAYEGTVSRISPS
jgi:predicted O-methyltransferase YrrM